MWRPGLPEAPFTNFSLSVHNSVSYFYESDVKHRWKRGWGPWPWPGREMLPGRGKKGRWPKENKGFLFQWCLLCFCLFVKISCLLYGQLEFGLWCVLQPSLKWSFWGFSMVDIIWALEHMPKWGCGRAALDPGHWELPQPLDPSLPLSHHWWLQTSWEWFCHFAVFEVHWACAQRLTDCLLEAEQWSSLGCYFITR